MKKFLLLIVGVLLVGCGTTPNSDTPKLEDFSGKPSVIVFGGTYCPHCQAAMPQFKTEVWDVYHQDANLWVNVIDDGRFDVADVAQGFSPDLTYEKITGQECEYVPSWVVLDKNLRVMDLSCGGEKNLDAMKKALAKQL